MITYITYTALLFDFRDAERPLIRSLLTLWGEIESDGITFVEIHKQSKA